MRKSSGWMILVALLTITAPTAFADSFSIVFTGGSTTPVDTIISFTPVSTGDIFVLGPVTDGPSTFTFTSSPLNTSANPQNDTLEWSVTIDGLDFVIFDPTTQSAADANFSGGQRIGFDQGLATITPNTVAAPEPSPVVLTLIGMGLLVVMRKR